MVGVVVVILKKVLWVLLIGSVNVNHVSVKTCVAVAFIVESSPVIVKCILV